MSSTNIDVNHLLNQLSAARNEIKNLRQQITSLKHAHRKDVNEIYGELRNWTCQSCRERGAQTTGDEGVSSNDSSSESLMRFIGHVETIFSSKRGVPRQPGILAQSQGILRLNNNVLNNPQHALEGLDQFSHMWILFYFHSNENTHVRAKVAPPRLNGSRTGVFATRSPHRPTPIGLSLVKIDNIEDDCIYFSGVDMVDGTPVIDVKPYVPQYDTPYPNPNVSSSNRSLHWERLPRESDGRSEDGDSILQDQSDTDFDFQDRLLVGEASQSNDVNSPSERVLDGRDCDDVFLNDTQMSRINIATDDNLLDRSPMRSTSQREAPEGSEGSSPPSPAQTLGNRSVRVADWIANPPVPRLSVEFTENSLRKIDDASTDSNTALRLRSSIVSILAEDPRSVYIRTRYSNEQFTCVVDNCRITCLFDDVERLCLVVDVETVNTLN